MERYNNLSEEDKKFFNSHVFPQPALNAEQTAVPLNEGTYFYLQSTHSIKKQRNSTNLQRE